MKLLIGIILLFLPFLLIRKFKDKRKGFLSTLFLVITSQFLLALISQFLGFFNYPVVLAANLLFAASSLLIAGFPKKLKRPDFVFLIVLVISFICLFSVHYNYTGDVTMADRSVKKVKDMNYPYPYFADEWYAVALIDYSLESGKAPEINPYTKEPFLNMEMPFHSFLAGIFLLLGLDPLTQYALLTIFFNLLIISLIYFFLRLNKLKKLTSAIAALFALYIINGNNLPGIWNLMPLNLGILSLLIGFSFIALNEKKMAALSSLLVFLFYPPLLPSYLLGLLFFSRKALALALGIAIFISGAFFFLVQGFLPGGAFNYLFNKVYHSAFASGIPEFSIYHIVPLLVIPLAAIAVPYLVKKKRWLSVQIGAGLFFWVFYSFSTKRIFLEYERLVFYVSILLVIASGFGLQRLILYLKKEIETDISRKVKYSQIAVIAIFFLFSFFYTQLNSLGWDSLVLVDEESGQIFSPAAPANNYLTREDLRIFEEIEGKRFLSIPWKGTVIGTVTGNYPLITKGGTITVGSGRYPSFMGSGCRKKKEKAKKWSLDYVYSFPFQCEGFKEIKKSDEGLVLYEFIPED